MKYVYRKHHSKLTTLMVGFGAGSRVEFNSKYPNGIAHFMEHVRFKGTTTRNNKLLTTELALYGGGWNAFTSNDMVCYHLSIPEDNIEKGCELLSDIIFNPTFPEDELEKEKEVVCQEIKMYDDDISSLISKKLCSKVFKNCLSIPIIGFEDTVKSITRQDILDFNKEFYNSNQMAVVLAAPNDYNELITKYFGTNDGVLNLLPKSSSVEFAESFEDGVIKEGQIQNNIALSFGSQNICDLSDSEAKVEIFNRIFGSSDVSRLFLKVREDLGLVYGIGSYYDDQLDGCTFTISTITEPNNKDQVMDAINEEIEGIFKRQPTNEELTMAKNKFKSRTYSAFDSSGGAANHALYELLVNAKSIEKLISAVEAVTIKDVLDVAEVMFSGNKYTVIGRGEK